MSVNYLTYNQFKKILEEKYGKKNHENLLKIKKI